MNRRDFIHVMAGAMATATLSRTSSNAGDFKMSDRPNILWISVEDMNPNLHCFGDEFAVTPNLDRLASEGVRYVNVFTHSPVCAPSRSGIITGMYPTTIGTHNMRCQGVPPPYVRCFTEYLRAVGYYCTNNVKTDYNFPAPLTAWDECSREAHWRKRPKGKPFFSVFNLTITHESKIRSRERWLLERIAHLKPNERHDPTKVKVPPYYPDTPVVRRDLAQYYDIITLMDKQVGEILKQLEDDGLVEDTIVWFWADHGRGLPRAKRWVYDSGIHVPLIIRIPEKFRKLASPDDPDAVKPGTVNEQLIAFVDFAPTMLSLADVKIPSYMQGRAFLGPQKAPPREYVFAARDRMDEAYDIIRAVRDKRFKYIRNYMPYVSHSQDIDYMNQTPTTKEMRRLHAEGKLTGAQRLFFMPTKPVEELYDTVNDPHEVHNIANDPRYKDVLERMRKVHLKWMRETGDVGLIPEPELDEMQRPNGEWQKTATPTFTIKSQSTSEMVVEIGCSTRGASIAYRIDGGGTSGWELYVQPVRLRPNQVLRAKACRLGFRDSDVAQLKFGERPTMQPPSEHNGLHWREQLDRTDLLERLLAIKALDGKGAEAIPKYLEALHDPYAAVRYWAVVGLYVTCNEPQDINRAKRAVAMLIDDPSPIVRIAVAEAMCAWGSEDVGLHVLMQMLHHRLGTVRLNAAIAIKRIGKKALRALPEIKVAMNDTFKYVPRVLKYVIKELEGANR